MAIPTTLPLSVQKTLVDFRMLEDTGDIAQSIDVIAGLPVLDQVWIYSLIHATRTQEKLALQKTALGATVDEIDANNIAGANWNARGKIASAVWPEDPAAQDLLRTLLEQDRLRTLPQPLPVGPPDLRTQTQREREEASKKSAEDILSVLTEAQAAADAAPDDAIVGSPWPTDPALQQELTEWLAAHGVPKGSLVADEVEVGGEWTQAGQLKTAWSMPEPGHMLSIQNPTTGGWEFYRNTNGQIHWSELFTTGDSSYDISGQVYGGGRAIWVAWSALDDHTPVVDATLWDGGDTQWGYVWRDAQADVFFWVPYGMDRNIPPLIPDVIGKVQPDGQRYFSDGTNVYHVAPNLWSTGMSYFQSDKAAVLDALEAGHPWEAFIGHGLTKVDAPGRMTDVSHEERKSWADHFRSRADQLSSNTNSWAQQAQSQQLLTQDLVKDLGNYINLATNADQRVERVMGTIVAGF
jgi:hypothetical protein